MKIQPHTYLEVEKNGKLIVLDVASDTPLGSIFDAIMEFKGYIVERMVSSHKEEEGEAEKQMKEEGSDGSDS